MCCTPTHTATEAAMLASISSRTSTRSNANTMTSNAGTRVSQCKSKADENNPPISVMLLALVETAALAEPAEPAVAAALAAPNPEPPLAHSHSTTAAATYTTQLSTNGTAPVLSMRAIVLNRFVCVSCLTSKALVETGEQRSPT